MKTDQIAKTLKSTTGQQNVTIITQELLQQKKDQQMRDFCCTECNSLFSTPDELFNHTKEKHLGKYPGNKSYNSDESNDIIILEDPPNNKEEYKNKHTNFTTKHDELVILDDNIEEKKKPKQSSVKTTSYYYFCLDCEAMRSTVKIIFR